MIPGRADLRSRSRRNPYSHRSGIRIHNFPERLFTCPGIRRLLAVRARCRLFTSNNLGCDPESQLDFIARKTCAIGGEPMLTAGGKEHRSGARIFMPTL